MALFDISGSGDWEVSEVGNKLCQNFVKDNPHKKKRKTKNKSKVKDISQKVVKNKTEKLKKTLTSSNLLNGKIHLLEKIRKFKKQKMEDTVPLNNSFSDSSYSSRKDGANKKDLKTEQIEKKSLSKTTKNQFKGLANSDDKINTNGFNKPESNKKRAKKRKKSEEKLNEISPKIKNKQLFVNNVEPTQKDKKQIDPVQLKKRKKQLQKLQKLLIDKEEKSSTVTKKNKPDLTLRQKMMRKLKAARFRFLNEQIYSTTGKETQKIFKHDPEAFKAYHEGYKLQVKRWPLNPLDKIINSLKKMSKTWVIADFGCGEARLAKSVEQKVHSFDLVAVNEAVTACDMAHVPLEDSSVDVVVFCLSLMGTNLKDYLLEASRVLKSGGLLKIAEVESRFEDIESFIKACEQYGFKKRWMDLSHNLFYFIDFKKESSIKDKKKLPLVSLQPCLYKKR